MAYELAPWVLTRAHQLWALCQSAFGTALAGAFAGAAGAAWIAERSAETNRNLEELRATNAAVAAAHSITNIYAALKRQQVKPLCDKYEGNQAAFEKWKASRARPRKVFEFEAGFVLLQQPKTTEPILEKLLFDRVSISQGGLAIFTLLAGSIATLNIGIENGNSSIRAWQAKPDRTPQELSVFYFGIPAEGVQDTQFPDTIRQLGRSTDDCLMFAYVLTKELVRHAVELTKRVGRRAPPVSQPDFRSIEMTGLLPDRASYDATLQALQIHLEPLPTAV